MAKQCASKQSMDHWRKKEEIKKVTRNKWKWKHNGPKLMQQNDSKREVHRNIVLLKETRKISNKKPNPHN